MNRFEERQQVIIENEGQKIFGVLHLPLTGSQVPAVAMCHGFAGNKVGKYRLYVQIAERLSQLGIASLRFDFRGSGDSEGQFSEMTIDSEVSDALASFHFLRSHPKINKDQIGLLGNSFGGAIAVLAAARDKQIRSLVLLAALFNSHQWRKQWESLMSNSSDESSQKALSRILEGHLPGSNFYHSFFLLDLEKALASLQKVPLLHIHSEIDERVGIDQAVHYERCRKDATADTQWIRLKKCDHDFAIAEERNMIIEKAAEWFARTLKS